MSNIITEYEYTSTDYEKIVPADISANDRAVIERIGGATKKCDNLIPFPYVETTITRSGITFTDNGDGSITLNGANDGTANSFFYTNNLSNPLHLTAGPYMGLLGHANVTMMLTDGSAYYTATSSVGFTLDSNKSFVCYLQVAKGDTTTFSNVTVYPMLNKGTTALPYEPYYEGFRHADVEKVESIGANLIPFPYYEYGVGTVTKNGIAWTVNADGSVTANGTATDTSLFNLTFRTNFNLLKDKYSLTGCPSGGNSSTYYLVATFFKGDQWVAEILDNGSGRNIDVSQKVFDGVTVKCAIRTGTVCNNLVFKPMLNYGTAPAPYKPYRSEPIDTITMPEAVRNLPDFGKGVNDTYYNYIEFKDDKVFYHHTCKELVFDGTEKWVTSGTDTSGAAYRVCLEGIDNTQQIDTTTISNIICNKYEALSASLTYRRYRGACIQQARVYIYDENYNTSDMSLWKAHLADLYASGNPLKVIYALATEEVTDITDLFTEDNSIEVEAGGTLRFVNEHKIPVPNTVVYVAKAPTLSLDGIKAKITNLIEKANSTTGKDYTDLTSGVNSLIEGYAGSSGPLSVTENGTYDHAYEAASVTWNENTDYDFNVTVDGMTLRVKKVAELVVPDGVKYLENPNYRVDVKYADGTVDGLSFDYVDFYDESGVYMPEDWAYAVIWVKDAAAANETIGSPVFENNSVYISDFLWVYAEGELAGAEITLIAPSKRLDGISSVDVAIDLRPIVLNRNGHYTPDNGAAGFSDVTVDYYFEKLSVTPTKEMKRFVGAYNDVTVEPIPNEYIKPVGFMSVSRNGEYDVTVYNQLLVNVPAEYVPEGYVSPRGTLKEGIVGGECANIYSGTLVEFSPLCFPTEYAIGIGEIPKFCKVSDTQMLMVMPDDSRYTKISVRLIEYSNDYLTVQDVVQLSDDRYSFHDWNIIKLNDTKYIVSWRGYSNFKVCPIVVNGTSLSAGEVRALLVQDTEFSAIAPLSEEQFIMLYQYSGEAGQFRSSVCSLSNMSISISDYATHSFEGDTISSYHYYVDKISENKVIFCYDPGSTAVGRVITLLDGKTQVGEETLIFGSVATVNNFVATLVTENTLFIAADGYPKPVNGAPQPHSYIVGTMSIGETGIGEILDHSVIPSSEIGPSSMNRMRCSKIGSNKVVIYYMTTLTRGSHNLELRQYEVADGKLIYLRTTATRDFSAHPAAPIPFGESDVILSFQSSGIVEFRALTIDEDNEVSVKTLNNTVRPKIVSDYPRAVETGIAMTTASAGQTITVIV